MRSASDNSDKSSLESRKHKNSYDNNSKKHKTKRKYSSESYSRSRSSSSYSYSNYSDRSEDIKKNSRKYKNANWNKNKKDKKKSISYKSKSQSRSKSPDRSKDAGHYKFKIGTLLHGKYIVNIFNNFKIESHLGDGTFGRVLECRNIEDNQLYAIKVIRPVSRYIESARIEADIILRIQRKDTKNRSHVVKMLECFEFKDQYYSYIALVFERLGSSLYEFIKANKYRGFSIKAIQSICKQVLLGMCFLHEEMQLTHTDLKVFNYFNIKPENILLKYTEQKIIKDRCSFPLNIKLKEKQYRSKSPSTRSYSKENSSSSNDYKFPVKTDVKIIDFGGATYEDERHSDIINTRQYRGPEVILGAGVWNEKSDIWSLACIFVELYSGELLFPTHDNFEHLCLIEKMVGK